MKSNLLKEDNLSGRQLLLSNHSDDWCLNQHVVSCSIGGEINLQSFFGSIVGNVFFKCIFKCFLIYDILLMYLEYICREYIIWTILNIELTPS